MNRLKNRIAIVSLILMALSMVGCQQSSPIDLESQEIAGYQPNQNQNSSFFGGNSTSQLPSFNFNNSGGTSSNSNTNGNSNNTPVTSCNNNSTNSSASRLAYFSQMMVAMCEPLVDYYLSESGDPNANTCQQSFSELRNQLNGQAQCPNISRSLQNLLSPNVCRNAFVYLANFVRSGGDGDPDNLDAANRCLNAIRTAINS